MIWDVEYSHDFGDWWEGLSAEEQVSVAASVGLLEALGPSRTAILLLGGDKTSNDRWYREFIPRADTLHDAHLAELKQKGLTHG